VRWLVLVLALAAGLHVWWRNRRSAARQRRLMLLCRRAGLEFAPLDLRPDTAWLPFPMFGRQRHGTENVVWDERVGYEVRAFDFWYEEEPTDERPVGKRSHLTCAVVPLRSACPRLRVTPRNLVDEVVEALGGEEVRLELEEFDRRFRVEADDARFAVAFLDQRLMEALLGLPEGVSVDVNGDVLLLSAPELPAEEVLLLYDAAVVIRRHIPRVVSSLFPPRPERGAHEARWLQGRWSPEPTSADAAPASDA
jgi:hypothetical protein